MQNTRLTNLFAAASREFGGWLQNPWRRTSLLLLSLLAGFFLATAVATTAGQEAIWDLPIAGVLAIACEVVSAIVYRRRPERRTAPEDPRAGPLLLPVLNLLKLGLIYGLFVEAFKLGS